MGTSKRMSSNGYFNIHKRSNCKQTHKFHNVGSFDLVCQQSFNTFFSNFHCIQFKTLNLCGNCRKTFLSGGSFNFHLLFHHEFCNQVSTARRESSFLFSSFLEKLEFYPCLSQHLVELLQIGKIRGSVTTSGCHLKYLVFSFGLICAYVTYVATSQKYL